MKSGKWKHALYLLAALCMLVFALPRLELSQPWTPATVFGVLWTALALLVIAANVRMLAVDRERERRRVAAIRRERTSQRVKLLERKPVRRYRD